MLRIIAGVVFALMLGACAQTTGMWSSGGGKPETIVVSRFEFAPDMVLLDRGFAAQLRRRMGRVTAEEMREQLAARVSREIATTTIDVLREAGLDAREGGVENVVVDQSTLLVAGKIRAIEQGSRARRSEINFGQSQVVADVVVTHHTFGSKKEALVFAVEAGGSRRPGPAGSAAGAGVAIEKLSADVEAAARRLGQETAREIVAFATAQGWLPKPGS